ncbi:acyltransferase [Vibrio hannami]|uniref:acyltransferase family protein n=1 Tax=Vibrio hannami TaxID=2717094 RepID=UPI00240EE9C4|nr:acyltransferase [Vibrio hannami]MDG3086063.1 acyltransferase [Vibrio hannami]
MFLKSIGNFRGLAIIMIVAGHLYITGFTSTGYSSAVIKNIITGGTALFVFISGFMFHYVFYKRYEYKKFISGKVKNVGIPYLILGSMAIFMSFLLSRDYFAPIRTLTIEKYNLLYGKGIIFNPEDSDIATTIKYYITGGFLGAYWYIPFAMLLFASAPLHIKFIKLDLRYQLLIISLLSIISLFSHRAINCLNPLQDLLYFTPVYLIGALVSMYSSEVKNYLNNKVGLLFFMVLLTSTIEYLSGHSGNYHKQIFVYAGVDLMYIQKFFLIFALYMFFEKNQFESKLLDTISNTSFAIFFIHPWVTLVLEKIYNILDIYPKIGENNMLLYCTSVIVVVGLSVLIALTTKKLFRDSKKTRYLIGY